MNMESIKCSLSIIAIIIWFVTFRIYLQFATLKNHSLMKVKLLISLSVAIFGFFFVWIAYWWSLNGIKLAFILGILSGIIVFTSLLIMPPLSKAIEKSMAEMKNKNH